MPTRVVSADNMSPGGKTGGKHWTKAEVESRQAAADGMKRKTRVVMRIPGWLGEEAKAVWRKTVDQLRGIELLDTVDSNLLAVYCDAYVKYQAAAKLDMTDPDNSRAAQTWARLMLAYTDKLGFTPGGRARLAKKRAEPVVDPFATEFD